MASGFRASVCGEKVPQRLPPALVAGYSGFTAYFINPQRMRRGLQ